MPLIANENQWVPSEDAFEIETIINRTKSTKSENDSINMKLKALSDRNEFLEDCIAEMAMEVYADPTTEVADQTEPESSGELV